MPTGRILHWNDRGFGFVGDDQARLVNGGYFVHVSALGGHAPEIGDRFSYDVAEGADGRPRAANLKPLTAEMEEVARVFPD